MELSNRRARPRLANAELEELGERILAAVGEHASTVSLVSTDDAAIQELNRDYRGKDSVTDVLSFSQVEGDPFAFVEERVLGDVVISMDTAARQAESIGHSLRDEVTRLLIHGVLHLLGHDHIHGGRQAARMRAEEARVLRAVRRNP